MALADELPKEFHCDLQLVVPFQTVSQGDRLWSKKELVKETVNQGKILSET